MDRNYFSALLVKERFDLQLALAFTRPYDMGQKQENIVTSAPTPVEQALFSETTVKLQISFQIPKYTKLSSRRYILSHNILI